MKWTKEYAAGLWAPYYELRQLRRINTLIEIRGGVI